MSTQPTTDLSVARISARHDTGFLRSLKARLPLPLPLPLPLKVQAAIASGHLRVLFDEKWYLEHNPDVAAAGVDPWDHFIRFGLHEQRSCHPLFDIGTYFGASPDLRDSDFSLVLHYLEYGWVEGRPVHPCFDGPWYARRYANDLEAIPPLIHYLQRGARQGFDPSPFFDTAWYAARNNIGDRSALEHFVCVGEAEGHSPHPLWNEELYSHANPELPRAGETGALKSLFRHFLVDAMPQLTGPEEPHMRRFAFQVGQMQLDYDETAYQEDNPDVRMSVVLRRHTSGLEHLFQKGFKEALTGERAIYRKDRFPGLAGRRPGAVQPDGKRACLFVHWDRHGLVDPYVLVALKTLKSYGFDIWVITTTKNPQEIEKFDEFVVETLIKVDNGRDFVSWYVAWNALGADTFKKYDELLLANDSVYFPISDPKTIFDKATALGYDVWSITDSRDWSRGQYHLQSYFVCLNRRAIAELMPRMMERVRTRPLLTKRGQVIEFEFGLTEIAIDLGLSVGALCPIDDIREDIIRDPRLTKWRPIVQYGLNGVNTNQQLWDLVILHYDCPVIKQDLLRSNLMNLRGVERWREIVGSPGFGIDARMIDRHLRRLKAPTEPAASRFRAASASVSSQPVAVREVIQGRGFGQGRDLVLLAHYDQDDVLDPYVLEMIKGLRGVDCDVALITASGAVATEVSTRAEVAVTVVKTPNARDFGSWWAAIRTLNKEFASYDSVIWMNDSIYFPIFDPRTMFGDMRSRNLDLWGVVDSYNGRWHIMSWLWAFSAKARHEGMFDWFTEEFNPTYSKWSQIRNYEMRIPELMRSKGLSAEAWITAPAIKGCVEQKFPDHPMRPSKLDFTMTHELWDVLIDPLQCPALKVELVRDNPLGLDISGLLPLLTSKTDYNVDLIRNHQRRVKAGQYFGAADNGRVF